MKISVLFDIPKKSYTYKNLKSINKLDKNNYLFISMVDSIEKAKITIMGLKIGDVIEKSCGHYPDSLKLEMKTSICKIATDVYLDK